MHVTAAAAVTEFADACNAAVLASERLAKAITQLDGAKAEITIRFGVDDTAVISHPLLGDAAEAILEGRGGDHT